MKKLPSVIFFVVSIGFSNVQAQDLKAGEINVKHLGGYSFEANVILYQHINTFVNRPYIFLDWGDGSNDTLYGAIHGCGDANTTSYKYTKVHSYNGQGIYSIVTADSFRLAGIVNINNSQTEELSLIYFLWVNSMLGMNSSAVALNCATDDWVCCNWTYNPGCFDPDGDSISYGLIVPSNSNYSAVPSTCNAVTGDITLSPTQVGQHFLCQEIKEWRKIGTTYSYIGATYRNMLINVASLSGIDDWRQSDEGLFINPNPATDKLSIRLSDSISLDGLSLSIYDALGRQCMVAGLEERIQEIGIAALPKGVYLLQVRGGEGVMSKKFVKE